MTPRLTWVGSCCALALLLTDRRALATEVAPPEPASTSADPAAPEPESWLVPSLHALGLMTIMRGTETYLWPEPFARTEHFAYHYEQAFTRPPRFDSSRPLFEADGDRWHINVLGHGLFGSELYLRARTCRKPLWQALVFTTAASTLWEYGFEANGVRPSGLDLVFTPVAGLVLGEARLRLWRWGGGLRGGGRAVVQGLVDPLGELERLAGTPC